MTKIAELEAATTREGVTLRPMFSFQNEEGHAFMFVYDPDEKLGVLTSNLTNWKVAYVFDGGFVRRPWEREEPLRLSESTWAWLAACWMAATGSTPRWVDPVRVAGLYDSINWGEPLAEPED